MTKWVLLWYAGIITAAMSVGSNVRDYFVNRRNKEILNENVIFHATLCDMFKELYLKEAKENVELKKQLNSKEEA